MRQSRGVLPRKTDSIIKDPGAAGTLVLVTLRPDLDRTTALAWLGRADALVRAVQASTDQQGRRTGTVAVGFGPSFFARFPDVVPPACFGRLPAVPGSANAGADVAFYVMATQESVVAALLTGLAATAPDVATIMTERGHKRPDDTEPFGYKDGVRNVRRDDRGDVVFVDRMVLPEEPAWAQSGTYMAWMKIPQDLAAFAALPPAEQDAAVGRDRTGRRLDLPEATRDEPAQTDALPPASHVRKTGPRGEAHDKTQIFRRGLPYAEAVGGQVRVGLQFVSFQASLDQLRTVLNRWMLNPDFPVRGCGQDILIARGLIRIETHGFFFVTPDGGGPIGAGMFAAAPAKARTPKTGRIAVRKRVVDTAGTELDVDLAGFTFQVTDPGTGQPVAEAFTTDSHGHALSPELPTRTPLRLTETALTAGATGPAPFDFELDTARLLHRVDNTVAPGTVYGG